MLLILIAIVAASVASLALLLRGLNDYGGTGLLSFVVGFFLAAVTGVCGVTYAVAVSKWLAAEHKAQIINREYGTHYTQEEVFWAHDVIDAIRQIDRKRIELNGNLMRKADE